MAWTSDVGMRAATTLCALFFSAAASAQQRQTVVVTTPASSSTYTQQLAIEVGDVPDHQVRVYEIRRTYSGRDAPMISGLAVKESWTRAVSDYIELNGLNNSYLVYIMENGDKLFARGHTLSESAPNAEGQTITKSWSFYNVWGGTGKFKNARGTVKSETTANIKAGLNQARSEITIWFVE